MNKKNIIVVGAGPGGLASAMLLAHRGFKVTVFEKAEQVGGRNAEIKLGDYRFDTGPTFLIMPFILREIFQAVGRNAEDYSNSRHLILFIDSCSRIWKYTCSVTGRGSEMKSRASSPATGLY